MITLEPPSVSATVSAFVSVTWMPVPVAVTGASAAPSAWFENALDLGTFPQSQLGNRLQSALFQPVPDDRAVRFASLSLANLFYAFLGALIGTLIGVLPGIGPIATLAMLLRQSGRESRPGWVWARRPRFGRECERRMGGCRREQQVSQHEQLSRGSVSAS